MNAFIRDLDDDIHRAAKVTAAAHGQTLSEFISRAIKNALSEDPLGVKVLRYVKKKPRRPGSSG